MQARGPQPRTQRVRMRRSTHPPLQCTEGTGLASGQARSHAEWMMGSASTRIHHASFHTTSHVYTLCKWWRTAPSVRVDPSLRGVIPGDVPPAVRREWPQSLFAQLACLAGTQACMLSTKMHDARRGSPPAPPRGRPCMHAGLPVTPHTVTQLLGVASCMHADARW